ASTCSPRRPERSRLAEPWPLLRNGHGRGQSPDAAEPAASGGQALGPVPPRLVAAQARGASSKGMAASVPRAAAAALGRYGHAGGQSPDLSVRAVALLGGALCRPERRCLLCATRSTARS